MRHTAVTLLAFGFAAGLAGSSPAQSASSSATVSNPGNCKVVERKAGDPPAGTVQSGSLSSSVTAGGGKVTGHTTGGNSVTVHSGDGRSSSTVTTGSSSGGTTVVTGSGTGDCTIYVDKK
jgi:hypothetical protein